MQSTAQAYKAEDFLTRPAIDKSRRVDALELAEAGTGTGTPGSHLTDTVLATRPLTTTLTYFSDGSAVRPPPAMSQRAWRALPTAAGKSFEWEGVVTELGKETFRARLRNVRGTGAQYTEIAEFDIEDVPTGDRELLELGGIFRWVVGLEARSGTRQKYSRIVFRRLPAWTQKTLEQAERKVKETVAGIKWSNDEPAGSQ